MQAFTLVNHLVKKIKWKYSPLSTTCSKNSGKKIDIVHTCSSFLPQYPATCCQGVQLVGHNHFCTFPLPYDQSFGYISRCPTQSAVNKLVFSTSQWEPCPHVKKSFFLRFILHFFQKTNFLRKSFWTACINYSTSLDKRDIHQEPLRNFWPPLPPPPPHTMPQLGHGDDMLCPSQPVLLISIRA